MIGRLTSHVQVFIGYDDCLLRIAVPALYAIKRLYRTDDAPHKNADIVYCEISCKCSVS